MAEACLYWMYMSSDGTGNFGRLITALKRWSAGMEAIEVLGLAAEQTLAWQKKSLRRALTPILNVCVRRAYLLCFQEKKKKKKKTG